MASHRKRKRSPRRDPAPALPAAPRTALVATAPAPPALDARGHDPADYDWVPVLRKPRADGWTPQRQRAFIEELAGCGSVATAARAVGMDASSAYRLRRAADGEAFAAAWTAAIQHAAHALVDAAFERAMHGSEEPVFDREGNRVGRRFRQSDGLMMFLLRKHFPERYGDLQRDRPPAPAASAPAIPSVVEALVAIGPEQPADPAALLSPVDLDHALFAADLADGTLHRWHRQDGREQAEMAAAVAEDDDTGGLGDRFEALLADAKRAADPIGHSEAERRRMAGESGDSP